MKVIKITNSNYNRYFPPNNKVNKKRLIITEESVYSCDNYFIINQYIDLINKYIKINKNTVLTDGTSNIGGAVINFAKFFYKINAVEKDETTCRILKHNIKEFKLEDKIKVHCKSYVEVMNTLKQDIVYLDPPWGGTNYRKHHSLKLYMNKYNISDIVNKLLNKTKLILLKIPKNFDINNFIKQTNITKYEIIKIFNKKKYLFNIILINT